MSIQLAGKKCTHASVHSKRGKFGYDCKLCVFASTSFQKMCLMNHGLLQNNTFCIVVCYLRLREMNILQDIIYDNFPRSPIKRKLFGSIADRFFAGR